MKIAKAIFEKLGFTSDEADKFLSSDETVIKDLKPDEIYKKTVLSIQKKLEEDGTIESLLDEKVKNKIGVILGGRDKVLRKELKAKGIEITDEEYNALPEKDRTDELIKLSIKKLSEKTSGAGDDKDKEITALRNQLQELADAKKNLEEVELPKFRTEAEKQIAQFKLDQAYRSNYAKALKGKLIADEDEIFPAIDAKLRSKYDIGEKDGEIVLFKKGTTTVAYHENSNKPVKLEEALTESAGTFIKKQDPPEKKRFNEKTEDKPGANQRTSAAREKLKKLTEQG